jgi:iron complex outermembrane receptor protein
MKKQILSTLLLAYTSLSFSQANQQEPIADKSTFEYGDTIKSKLMEPIEIRAVRAEKNYPFTQNLITKRNIEKNNLGQDIPFLLNQIPGAVVNSDAGNGVGYTGIRIRGTDPSRINFTLNGIAYNDAESQGVFLVNLPDFLSSTNSIQVQRGVGTSANGPGAFGATINLMTNEVQEKAYATLSNSIGSFNTMKNTIKTGTGLINGRYTIDARLSNISSDGYIDRSSSKLQSFYVSAASIKEKSSLRLNVFSGKEKTGQAWYGVSEEQLSTNRKFNSAGSEKPGEPYENETDNYTQTHYQLFYNKKLNSQWDFNAAVFATTGNGYYEQYKASQELIDYGILRDPFGGNPGAEEADLIRQLWLDNLYTGTNFSFQKKYKNNEIILGGGMSNYDGNHFGKNHLVASGYRKRLQVV